MADTNPRYPSPLASRDNPHLREELNLLTDKHVAMERRLAALEAAPVPGVKGNPSPTRRGLDTAPLGTSMGPAQAPAKANSPGTPGQITWDSAGYLYMCVGPNQWVRSSAVFVTF